MSFVSGSSSTSGTPYSNQGLISFQGLESGLNTSSIINALMAEYSAPLDQMEAQQQTYQNQISAYQALSSDLTSLYTAAETLSAPDALSGSLSAASSDASVATANVGPGTEAGSTTFVVDQLAQAESLISAGTTASASDIVAGADLLIGVGGQALGVTSIDAGTGLASGNHTVKVTQASAGASVTGSAAPAASTTITSSNDTVSVSLDGAAAVTYTLASGTYSPSQLASALAAASGGTLTASIDASGDVVVTTTEQGSKATLSITGGSALGALGVSTSSTPATGTDAVVEVDGTYNTVSDISGSGLTSLTLTSGTGGTLDMTVSKGLSLGTMDAVLVSTQGGSLSGVVQAINQSGLAVTASAVQLASGGYALEISSESTGAANAVTIDPASFASSSLGALQVATAAQEAVVSLGGSGGPQITSSTNDLTGLIPGATVKLASTSSSPVTITVSPDGSVVAPKVQALVDAANKLLGDIATDTAYDKSTNTAGPLNGQTAPTELEQQVLSLVGAALGTSAIASGAKAAGIGLSSSGQLTFDQSAFEAAYDANPQAVGALLTQAGSFNATSPSYSGQVSLATATDGTQPGSYEVVLTQAASQAQDAGAAGFASESSTLGSAGTYTISEGSSSASYSFTAGETLSQFVDGLNAALASSGSDVSARLSTNGSGQTIVVLTSAGYGSAESFTVSSSGSDPLGLASTSAFSGTDVAGTINGVTATGHGQYLSAPISDPTLAGLTLQVTATAVSAPTILGTFDYSPGMAQGLASLAREANAAPSGIIAASIAGLQTDAQGLSSEISAEQQVVEQEQAMLQQEFNYLETSLAQLKAQGSALGSALSGGPTPIGG